MKNSSKVPERPGVEAMSSHDEEAARPHSLRGLPPACLSPLGRLRLTRTAARVFASHPLRPARSGSFLRVNNLVAVLLFSSLAQVAYAEGSSAAKWAKDCVMHRLITPLTKQESQRSRFSRSAPAPRERRVSIVATEFSTDPRNQEFIPYQIEVRYGQDWQSSLQGCVYRGSGDVFVAIGDEYRPAAYLLGKDEAAVPGVCQSSRK
jgi:hypothetical protein